LKRPIHFVGRGTRESRATRKVRVQVENKLECVHSKKKSLASIQNAIRQPDDTSLEMSRLVNCGQKEEMASG
jgi:hypothetical protein